MERATEMFVNYLKRKHDTAIDGAELIWEAITMYQDEIDHELFPIDNLERLPDPLLFLTTSYVDQDEQEWIFCIVTEEENVHRWFYVLCLKNGELVDKEIPLNFD